MKKTKNKEHGDKLTVSTPELEEILGCGRDTATKIGIEAQAKIKIGRRVLWNVAKIQTYLNGISE